MILQFPNRKGKFKKREELKVVAKGRGRKLKCEEFSELPRYT